MPASKQSRRAGILRTEATQRAAREEWWGGKKQQNRLEEDIGSQSTRRDRLRLLRSP